MDIWLDDSSNVWSCGFYRGTNNGIEINSSISCKNATRIPDEKKNVPFNIDLEMNMQISVLNTRQDRNSGNLSVQEEKAYWPEKTWLSEITHASRLNKLAVREKS